ncbi:MAG TPA: apolipoprotein N-acyltransferase [Mycobacteriales bacterium]|nr:apolipoprotein N-acyltransferase [Mycobacteriales bacterium]
MPSPVAPLWAATCAIASGLAVWASFAPLDLWWLAPIGIALLTVALLGQSVRTGLWVGGLHGLTFFVPLLHWTGTYVGWFPWILLAVVQAAYLALLGAAVAVLSRLVTRWGATIWLLPPTVGTIWVAQEALRCWFPWGGFPWGRLAFGQTDGPLLWWATLAGAPAVTFAAALSGAAVAVGLHWWRSWLRLPGTAHLRRAAAVAAALGCVFGVSLAAEGLGPNSSSLDSGPLLRVAVVQGDVPRAGLDFSARRRAVLDNHLWQTHLLADQVAHGERKQPDVVIWPENSSDIDPYSDPRTADLITDAAQTVHAPILVGAVIDGPGHRVRNVGIVWDPTFGPVEQYTKRHPVPFAEYVPYRGFFRSITSEVDLVPHDFAAGSSPGVLRLGKARIGDVICFEVGYDALSADVVRGGAQLFVVQTNNATFGTSAQSAQQLAMTRLRAVEHDRFAVMASTTGISATVSPTGHVLDSTKLFTSTVLLRDLRLGTSRTLATTAGSWPTWIMSSWALAMVALAWWVSRRPTNLAEQDRFRASGGCVMVPAGPPTTITANDNADTVDGESSTPNDQDSELETDSPSEPRVETTPANARVLVIIPTFNEAENIEQITERLRAAAPDVALLIADDNSPDGTGAIADSLAERHESVSVLHREGKQGLGAAYIAGFDWAREREYDVVVEMDADGSHAPEDLPRLLEALAEADLVIGSRWVPGGEVRNWPRRRQLLSRMGNWYARRALGFPIADATGGYRTYRREVLDAIDWKHVASQGYCFQVDLTWRTYRAGFRITERPIAFTEREHGHSKMSSLIVAEAFWLVALWGARHRLRQLARSVRGLGRKFKR